MQKSIREADLYSGAVGGAIEHGTVANLAQPMYYQQEPPEAQSIKSMLHIARILAIIFGIILLLAGLAYVAFIIYLSSICSTYIGFDAYCGGFLVGYLIFPIFIVIWGVVDFLIYVNLKGIEAMVNARQYEQAKGKTLIWMIIGFILGGILLGIILLIAYIKFDPLINSQRAMMGGQPPQGGYPPQGGQPMYATPPPQGYGAPPPQAAPMAAPAPAPAAPAGGSVPFCPTCGKPGTYVAQYGRYYCYDDKIYL
jgi:hypothetical protein